MQNNFEKLFSPLKIKNNLLKNRFVLSPITLNASSKNGFASKKDINYALKRAHSAPLSITSAAYINKEAQLFEFGFSLMSDKHIESMKKVANAMKIKGSKAIVQLTHSGRFSIISHFRNGYVVGPSKRFFNFPKEHYVQELSIKDIKKIVKDYENATLRAIKAGFDGVEISSAQRLLLQAFFSKNENKRNDKYGSQNIKNRSRLTLEVLSSVQKIIKKHASKNFILGFRATPEEILGQDIGFTFDEFLNLIENIIKKIKIDYLSLASWGKNIYLNKVRTESKYKNWLWTKAVRDYFKDKLILMINGGINSPEKCIEAIEHVDLIGLSSVFIADPDFALKIEKKQFESINLNIIKKDLNKLSIPKAAFKEIVQMMDYGASLPQESRDELRKLENNYKNIKK
ncbi:oxidoreductase [Mycoplasmopsis cricetuli]|uniref:oxidoreductase n=1 Tax=Mycoplasmopsis cricetuli TaxID=171283 RepID=UPI0004702753|nr:NADH-dependent flavin oxidoreductase [Mycoplasmopsis cricetuli]